MTLWPAALGTPAYMAPEQASGEVQQVDRRADVFGLGSILCEILTGQPAYAGRNQHELIRKAMRGDTADARARLACCGAESELVALANDCLAVEPEDRPRDAGEVAERITAYMAGVQDRVQTAERERAVAEARAIEERRGEAYSSASRLLSWRSRRWEGCARPITFSSDKSVPRPSIGSWGRR